MAATFQVAIAGVDKDPELRSGDISHTGLYVECRQSVGPPGSVQWLKVGLPEDAQLLQVLCRVVRVATIDDLWRGRQVLGTAFEFMRAEPQTTDGSADPDQALAELVKRVAREHLGRDALQLDRPLPAQVTDAPPAPTEAGDGSAAQQQDHSAAPSQDAASVQRLSLHGMTLQTEWPVPQGETVRIEVPGPDSEQKGRFIGRVCNQRSRDGQGAPYLIDVEFTAMEQKKASIRPDAGGSAGPASATGSSMAEVVGALVDDMLAPRPEKAESRREHLFGDVARIPFPSLLTLFEMDGMTGVLRVERQAGTSHVYVDGGRIVDAEGPEGRGREVLAALMEAGHGTFEFSVQGIDRPDVLQMPTTALLLDLARESDETRAR
jgi:hypothetical protein